MAKYQKLVVQNGFVRGTSAGITLTIGASADVRVRMQVHAKTVSDVYSQLEKVKYQFSQHTWEKIQKAHVGGSVGFFFELFNLMAGGSYDYYNKKTDENIQQSKDAQTIAKAYHDSDTSDVVVEGTLQATGMSYVPTVAYLWVNLTQVTMKNGETTNAIANNPTGNVADATGSDKDISGHGTLHVLPSTVQIDPNTMVSHLRA